MWNILIKECWTNSQMSKEATAMICAVFFTKLQLQIALWILAFCIWHVFWPSVTESQDWIVSLDLIREKVRAEIGLKAFQEGAHRLAGCVSSLVCVPTDSVLAPRGVSKGTLSKSKSKSQWRNNGNCQVTRKKHEVWKILEKQMTARILLSKSMRKKINGPLKEKKGTWKIDSWANKYTQPINIKICNLSSNLKITNCNSNVRPFLARGLQRTVTPMWMRVVNAFLHFLVGTISMNFLEGYLTKGIKRIERYRN